MKPLKIGDEHPTKYNDMPDGLTGYWWETEHQICVPVIFSNNEGDGTFSKWLTELEAKHKTIFFPTIISARLDFILRKHGYDNAYVVDGEMGVIDGLAKRCSGE
jgi:hypothetical protein